MERFVQGDEQAFPSSSRGMHAACREPCAGWSVPRRTTSSRRRSSPSSAPAAATSGAPRSARGSTRSRSTRRATTSAGNRREEPTARRSPTRPAEPAPLPDPGLTRTVEAALAQLPENQREAIVLHRFEGFSFREIAELLGVTETAVKVRAHRGYERLRVLLASQREPA